MRDALLAPDGEYDRGVGPATDSGDAPRGIESLYWSRPGEVACVAHAPEPASSRWSAERWAPMPVTAMNRHGLLYQCQHCSTSGRPINHRRMSSHTE